MNTSSFQIRDENEGDAPALSELSAEAFGPGRFARTAYRVREGIPPVPSLSLTGWLDGRLVGGIRFTAMTIGGEEKRFCSGRSWCIQRTKAKAMAGRSPAKG